jgi:poly(ADP-ribose) glycohydrolase
VFVEGTIEDAKEDLVSPESNILEVDFANKMIGGGVLGNGCVQEEIRFLVNTELLVSRLFTERLVDNECIIITGSERFCKYKGYAESFEFAGDYTDLSKRDKHGRLDTKIVAVSYIMN